MKKFIYTLMFVFFSSLTVNAQSVTFEGNTIVAKKSATKSSQPAEKTPYTYKDTKGNVYDIYISASGSCFINKTSAKTGKEYKQYLGVDISIEICNKLGREYKGKKKS